MVGRCGKVVRAVAGVLVSARSACVVVALGAHACVAAEASRDAKAHADAPFTSPCPVIGTRRVSMCRGGGGENRIV